jgi:hypothetical protein
LPVPAKVDLKARLDELYNAYNAEHIVSDPIWIVRRYRERDDQEIVGFCAAALAFGRVQSVLNSIEALVAVMGPRPAEYVRHFDPSRDRQAQADDRCERLDRRLLRRAPRRERRDD